MVAYAVGANTNIAGHQQSRTSQLPRVVEAETSVKEAGIGTVTKTHQTRSQPR
jgi:hypothetical protein